MLTPSPQLPLTTQVVHKATLVLTLCPLFCLTPKPSSQPLRGACDKPHTLFFPLQIAASAVLLANHLLHRPVWGPTLQHYTQFSPSDLRSCCQLMLHVHVSNSRGAVHTCAIKDKYRQPRYFSVAAIPTRQELPAELFSDRRLSYAA